MVIDYLAVGQDDIEREKQVPNRSHLFMIVCLDFDRKNSARARSLAFVHIRNEFVDDLIPFLIENRCIMMVRPFWLQVHGR